VEWELWKWRNILQKKVVEEKDFERYSFPIPLNYILGRRKQKFVFSELEKRHPCFSDDYCFDIQLGLKRNKVFSDVIVMKKSRLMEYEQKNGKGLFFPSCKKRRFIEKNKKLFILAGFIIAGFILIGLFKIRNTEREIEFVEIQESNDSVDVITKPVSKNVSELFKVIQDEKGKIFNLDWKLNGNQYLCSALISSVYPERVQKTFSDENFSSISYENGTPEFVYAVKESCGAVCYSSMDSVIKSEEIRMYLFSRNCRILEEKIDSYSVKFFCCMKKDFFEELQKVVSGAGGVIERFVLDLKSCEDDYDCVVEMHLGGGFDYEWGFDLACISEFFEIFSTKKKNQKQSGEVKKEVVRKSHESGGGVRIGEVMYENGDKMVFYKNEKGKLIKKLEKRNE